VRLAIACHITLVDLHLEEMGLFTTRNQPVPTEPPISEAEKLGVHPPRLSDELRAGIAAAAQIGQDRSDAKLKAYEAHRDARREAEQARDDALWAKVVARNRNAVG
jgi:hypothetical protein